MTNSRASIERLMSIHRVAIKLEVTSVGGGMGTVRDYAAVAGKSSVPCRCVPQDWTDSEEAGVRGHRQPWVVRFPSSPGTLTEKNVLVFVDGSGATHELQVKRVLNPHDLDYFWRANCLEVADAPVQP